MFFKVGVIFVSYVLFFLISIILIFYYVTVCVCPSIIFFVIVDGLLFIVKVLKFRNDNN